MITTIFRIVAQFMAALFCFIPALIGSYTTGSNYTIPQIDLSAAPGGRIRRIWQSSTSRLWWTTAGTIWLTQIPSCSKTEIS